MTDSKIVIYPDSEGILPNAHLGTCLGKLYVKFLIKAIGNRTVIANASISPDYGPLCVDIVGRSALIVNSDFSRHILITNRKND